MKYHSTILISCILGSSLVVSCCGAKGNMVSLIEQAKQYEKQSDYGSAIIYWNEVLNRGDKKDKPIAQFHIAKSYFKLGDMARAIEKFENFVKKYPDDSKVCFSRKYLVVMYGMHREHDQVIKHCKIIINNCKNDELVCGAMLDLGITYYFLEEFDKSREQLQKVLDTCDREYDLTICLIYLARADQAENKYFESLEFLYQILVDYPDSKYVGDCKYLVGVAWSKLGKTEKAIPLLETTIKKYPNSVEYEKGFSELMCLYEVNEQYEKIIEQCEKYVENSNHLRIPKYLFYLVRNYIRTNTLEKARKAYNKLLKDYPDDGYVKLARKEIDNLKAQRVKP